MTIPDSDERRISVGNSEMTRRQVLDSLEANIGLAKDSAAELLSYLGRPPSSIEHPHIVHEVQRIQGYVGGILLPMVRALRDDENDQQKEQPQGWPLDELQALGFDDLMPLLNDPEGAYLLLAELRTRLPGTSADLRQAGPRRLTFENYFRAWEIFGLLYLQRPNGQHDALALFRGLYDRMLERQQELDVGIHKGVPLVWMAECQRALAHPVLAKRYMLLTAIEDAIRHEGRVPRKHGVYFRLVWHFGMAPGEVERYSEQAARLELERPQECRYPEWVLQDLDQDWIVEFPTSLEAAQYDVTLPYVSMLIERLGDPTGQTLERLARYLLSSIPGCRTHGRQRSHSTDYDVVCAPEGLDLDFRSDLGRYFVCECKDWQSSVDFSAFAKFCRVLDSAKCRFGIIFSRLGISGQGKQRDAELEQIKVYQDRGMVIIVITEDDLRAVAAGAKLYHNAAQKVRRDTARFA